MNKQKVITLTSGRSNADRGARYYEFSKALAMYTDIKDKILLVDESLDFTIEQLKEMWVEAKAV